MTPRCCRWPPQQPGQRERQARISKSRWRKAEVLTCAVASKQTGGGSDNRRADLQAPAAEACLGGPVPAGSPGGTHPTGDQHRAAQDRQPASICNGSSSLAGLDISVSQVVPLVELTVGQMQPVDDVPNRWCVSIASGPDEDASGRAHIQNHSDDQEHQHTLPIDRHHIASACQSATLRMIRGDDPAADAIDHLQYQKGEIDQPPSEAGCGGVPDPGCSSAEADDDAHQRACVINTDDPTVHHWIVPLLPLQMGADPSARPEPRHGSPTTACFPERIADATAQQEYRGKVA